VETYNLNGTKSAQQFFQSPVCNARTIFRHLRFYANLVFDFTPATLLTIAFRYSEIIRNYRKAAKGHKKARPEKEGRPGGLRKGRKLRKERKGSQL
jgi:hypothetical protein